MKNKVKVSLNPIQLFATAWTVTCQVPLSRGFTRQEYWVGCHFLLQGIFPTQGSNSCLRHCRQILYLLSHQETAYLILRSIWKKNNKDYCCKRKKKFWRSSSISWKRWLLIKLINMKYTVEWRTNVCSVCLRCSLQLVNLSCHPLTLHSHLNFQWKLKFLKVVFQNKIFLAPYLLQYSEH